MAPKLPKPWFSLGFLWFSRIWSSTGLLKSFVLFSKTDVFHDFIWPPSFQNFRFLDVLGASGTQNAPKISHMVPKKGRRAPNIGIFWGSQNQLASKIAVGALQGTILILGMDLGSDIKTWADDCKLIRITPNLYKLLQTYQIVELNHLIRTWPNKTHYVVLGWGGLTILHAIAASMFVVFLLPPLEARRHRVLGATPHKRAL